MDSNSWLVGEKRFFSFFWQYRTAILVSSQNTKSSNYGLSRRVQTVYWDVTFPYIPAALGNPIECVSFYRQEVSGVISLPDKNAVSPKHLLKTWEAQHQPSQVESSFQDHVGSMKSLPLLFLELQGGGDYICSG